mgnify:CR=1 FL=1
MSFTIAGFSMHACTIDNEACVTREVCVGVVQAPFQLRCRLEGARPLLARVFSHGRGSKRRIRMGYWLFWEGQQPTIDVL